MQKHTKDEKQFLALLGNRIKEIRLLKGFTQPHVAALYDSEKAHFCRIEQGKVNTTIITLQKIALILQIPVSELFSLK